LACPTFVFIHRRLENASACDFSHLAPGRLGDILAWNRAARSSMETRSRHDPQCPVAGRKPDSMTYVIAQPCIGTKDASCVEVCPVDCIHSDDDAEMYFIDPNECIDCGVCAEVCPVEAIFFEDDLPEQWSEYLKINADYFEK
jgi:ferredoxin